MKYKIIALFIKIQKSIICFRKDRGSFGISYQIQLFKNKSHYQKLKKYKNIHENKKCFIIGTGPSLTLKDINNLKGQYCIGANTLYKLYSQTDWRATYYCIIDPATYSNISLEVKKYHRTSLFIAGNRIKDKDPDINKFSLECSSFYKIPYSKYFKSCSFGNDLSKEIYDGASVIYAAIQIAVYMGFREIYLLGVDCNYDNGVSLHSASLEYSKDYHYNWTKQTGLTMIEGFKTAKKYADEHGIHIFNATRGGMLEVFPRINLDDAVKR